MTGVKAKVRPRGDEAPELYKVKREPKSQKIKCELKPLKPSQKEKRPEQATSDPEPRRARPKKRNLNVLTSSADDFKNP